MPKVAEITSPRFLQIVTGVMRRLREKMTLNTKKYGAALLILYLGKRKSRKMKGLDLPKVPVLVSGRCKY